MTENQDALQRVIDDVVTPSATDVDASGAYPRKAVTDLGEAGILGLTVPAAAGGGGQGLRQAADVVQRLAGVCGSTAMVVLMHYAATVVIDNHGPNEVRRAIGAGRHLSTLAFSEVGSRSHFWAPQGTATGPAATTNTATQAATAAATTAAAGAEAGTAAKAETAPTEAAITTEAAPDEVRLDARKSWVTSAGEADSYVWSSRPLAAEGPMTLWLVHAATPGLTVAGPFDGLGLRGNRSTPIDGSGVFVPTTAMLGADGAGLDLALAEVLPWFLVMSAAFSVGLMEAATAETGEHLRSSRLDHLDQSLAEQPLMRVDHARMRVATDQAAALLADTLTALETGRADAMLRVLEVKAAAGEAAILVTDLAMKVCGGAAFRKELGVERRFRDARAARVMAPTTDALLDFIGRAINGLPLL